MAVLNRCKFFSFAGATGNSFYRYALKSFLRKEISLKCINYFFFVAPIFPQHFSGDIEKCFICRLVFLGRERRKTAEKTVEAIQVNVRACSEGLADFFPPSLPFNDTKPAKKPLCFIAIKKT